MGLVFVLGALLYAVLAWVFWGHPRAPYLGPIFAACVVPFLLYLAIQFVKAWNARGGPPS